MLFRSQTTIKTDIHCVTKWSKFDTAWQGVTFDNLLKAAGIAVPPASYIIAHCDGGYTTNLPLADLVNGQDGRDPLWGLVDSAGAWRPSSPARTAPLLLEKRQVGEKVALYEKRRTRLLGIARLSQ